LKQLKVDELEKNKYIDEDIKVIVDKKNFNDYKLGFKEEGVKLKKIILPAFLGTDCSEAENFEIITSILKHLNIKTFENCFCNADEKGLYFQSLK
jgi:hypothetical protein